jgi:hypothetical protein
MKRSLLGLAALALALCGVEQAKGEFLHASANILVEESNGPGAYLSNRGATIATASYFDSEAGAFAQAQADPTKLVRATVFGTANAGDEITGSGFYYTYIAAQAIWEDTIHISGPNPPSFVDLHFHYSAVIPNTGGRVPSAPDSIFDFTFDAEADNGFGAISGVQIRMKNGAYDPQNSSTFGIIDSLSLTSSYIDTSFHIPVLIAGGEGGGLFLMY